MPGGPIIWSETRQELCESLPYYRAYQTGSYVTGNLGRPPSTSEFKLDRKSAVLKDSIPYGYLLAGWPSRRDAWAHNGKVIISHGGGKSEVGDTQTGSTSSPSKASLKQDQSASDSIIRALLHSSRHRLPIVLIAADSYALLPFELNCSYAVLGWYLITDCWAERESTRGESGFVRWKFRFEWIPAQGEPWWALKASSSQEWDPRQRIETFTKARRKVVKQMQGKEKSDEEDLLSTAAMCRSVSPQPARPLDEKERHRLLYGPIQTLSKLVSSVTATLDSHTPYTATNTATCICCKHPSPIVFDRGWICLHPECSSFFRLPSGEYIDEEALTFSTSFLLPHGPTLNSAFPHHRPPFSLIPTRPSSRSMDQARGLWCRRCGRLSCREVIFEPRCSHCGRKVGKWKPLPTVQAPVLSGRPFDLSSTSEKVASSVFDPVISASSGIVLSTRRMDGLVMYTFTFPDAFGDCRVHLVQADFGRGEQEADEIFASFQRHTWPKHAKDGAEEDNGAVDGVTDDVESCRRAKRVKTQLALAHDDDPSSQLVPFRRHPLKHHAGGSGRMLTQQFTCNYGVAYKHVVAMGTQPLTATSPACILSTLSLLSARTASVHPLTPGYFNELYPVLYLQHQKMGFHDDGEPGLGAIVASLSLGSSCRMKFRLKAKHVARFAHVDQRDRTVLDLPLRHGAVVVQQGHDLQHFFEHSVNPSGFRIAITARRIDAVENEQGGDNTGRRSSSTARSSKSKVTR